MIPLRLPLSWTAEQCERYEERAGIKEFCGNMKREEAERQALAEVSEEIRREKGSLQWDR